jgi:hypothetical protein
MLYVIPLSRSGSGAMGRRNRLNPWLFRIQVHNSVEGLPLSVSLSHELPA